MMRNEFTDLKQMIQYYKTEKIPAAFDTLTESVHKNTVNQTISQAENKLLDNDFTMLLSFYHADGSVYCFQKDHIWYTKNQVPSQGTFHRHQFIEILYVVEGSFDQLLMGEHLHFEKGKIVITDQNCEHSDCILPTEGVVFFLQISSRYMDELLCSYDEKDEVQRFLFHALERQKKEQSFLELQRGSEQADRKAVWILQRLYEEFLAEEEGYEQIRKGLLIRLLHCLCTEYSPILHSSTQEGKEKAILYELERYIRLHYATVTVASLEQDFHYHRNYYSLLLKKYRNKSFKQYVLDVRLLRAQELLSTTTLPVKEVANRVGYENTSHFYHLYERKFHCKPRSLQH